MATGSNRHYTVVLRNDNGGIHLHTVSLDSQKPDPQETVLPPGPAAQVGLTRPVPVRTLLKAGFSGSGVRRQGRSPVDHDIMLCRRMFGVLGAAPSVSCKSARNACQNDSAERDCKGLATPNPKLQAVEGWRLGRETQFTSPKAKLSPRRTCWPFSRRPTQSN